MPELSEGTINAKKKSPAELAISTEDDGKKKFYQKMLTFFFMSLSLFLRL